MQTTAQHNYNCLMLCRPILADNWQTWVPHLSRIQSIFNLVDLQKIEKVEYREIKKIVESEIIGKSDREKIKKERKLANNRRAARNFRNRALSSSQAEALRIRKLRKERDYLAREKQQLYKEIYFFKQETSMY